MTWTWYTSACVGQNLAATILKNLPLVLRQQLRNAVVLGKEGKIDLGVASRLCTSGRLVSHFSG